MRTGFYQVNKLTKSQQVKFYKDAVLLSYSSYVQELDCNKSWQRRDIKDKSIIEVIDMIRTKKDKSNEYITMHCVAIDRSIQNTTREEYEVGCNNISGEPSYFLCCYLNKDNFYKLINKYKLEEKIV